MRSALLFATLVLAACKQQPEVAPSQSASAEPVVTPTAEPATPEKPFQALGTEPFWTVEVLPGQLRYSDPENIAGIAFAASETREGAGVRYSGTLNGRPVSLLVQRATCSDGMSDTAYQWTAVLTKDSSTLQGCARKQ